MIRELADIVHEARSYPARRIQRAPMQVSLRRRRGKAAPDRRKKLALVLRLSRILFGDREIDPVEQLVRVMRLMKRLVSLAADNVHGGKSGLKRFLRLQTLNRCRRMASGHRRTVTLVAHAFRFEISLFSSYLRNNTVRTFFLLVHFHVKRALQISRAFATASYGFPVHRSPSTVHNHT